MNQLPKVMINNEICIKNADGAYVPIARIREIDLLRDELVREFCEQARALSDEIDKFRQNASADINAFADSSAEEHGIQIRGRKGGFSLMSYDGRLKIVIDNDTLIAVNEKVSVAREAVFACVRRWSDGANANLVEIVRRAFEVDKQGHLSVARLLSLRSYKIDDAEWSEAMEALAQGLTAYGSKTYIRYYQRASTEEKFEQIALG